MIDSTKVDATVKTVVVTHFSWRQFVTSHPLSPRYFLMNK